jgi:membrane-bound serine protease (ClpP class)
MAGEAAASRRRAGRRALALACWALLLIGIPGAAERQDPPEPGDLPGSDDLLLKTYVTGLITSAVVDGVIAEVERWLEERPEIRFIVFELDTPGGEIEASQKLANFIFSDLRQVTTIAFVPPGRYAFSGGTLVALATRELVMGSNSQIGAAAPIAVGGDGPVELGEKVQAPVRTFFRTYAEDRGYPTILTDAMVSKDHEDILKVQFRNPEETVFLYRSDYDNLNPEDRLRRVGDPQVILRKGQLLTVNEKEAKEYGFVEHIADDLTELRNDMLLPIADENVIDARMGRLKSRFPPGQAIVDFLNKPVPRFILLLCGCLGLLIELKSFGILVPGLVGMTCFIVFFVTSMLPVTGSVEGSASLAEVLLFVLGVGLLAVEVFLLPGMAVFAITGTALCAVSLVLAMVPPGGTGMGPQTTVEDAIGILAFGFGAGTLCFLVLLRFLPHNPLFARQGLVSQSTISGVSTADSVLTAQAKALELVGTRGTALTMLRPAGKMETEEGRVLDVVTDGEFIEQGTRVRVQECREGRIRVVRAGEE